MGFTAPYRMGRMASRCACGSKFVTTQSEKGQLGVAVREASGRHLPDIKWGRLVASERQPKQPSSCPDTPPTHAVPLLPVWPLTAGPRARLRRKLVTAVVTPVHRCDGCLSDRDKQAS